MAAPLLCTVSGVLYGPSGSPVEAVKVRVYVTSAFTDASGNYIPAGLIAETATTDDGTWSLDVLQTASLGRSVTFQFEYPIGNEQANTVQYAAVVPNQDDVLFSDLVDLSTGAAIIQQNVTTDSLPEGEENLYYTNARATSAATALIGSLGGQPDGLATLGSDGKVPLDQLPDLSGDVTSVNGQQGDVVLTADDLLPSQTGNSGRVLTSNGTTATWEDPAAGGVTSVQGDTGDVVLDSDDIPEGISNLYYEDSRVDTRVNSILSAQKGAANGLASLDGSGLLPSSQLPPIAVTDTFVVASQSAMLALTAQVGDIAVRTDTDETYILQTSPPSTLANWVKLRSPSGGSVTSVNGQTGTVSLTSDDISEGSTNKYFTTGRASAAAPVQSVNSKTGAVSLTTSDISESTNLYYTDTRAKAAAVVNSLAGSQTDQAPSVGVVNTALSGKQSSGSYITALTGDVTASGPGSAAATLANSGVTAGSYTNPSLTVDAKGRITAASNGSTSALLSVATKSSAYTLSSSDDLILADASSAAFTLTLPTASTVIGKVFYLKKTDSTLNVVTISGTIDGGSRKLSTQNEELTVVSNGTNYSVLGRRIFASTSNSLTPTFNGLSVTSGDYYSRREADQLIMNGSFVVSSASAATAYLTLPTGYTMDTGKLGSTAKILGQLYGTQSAAVGVSTYLYLLFYDGSDSSKLFIASRVSGNTWEKRNASDTFNSSSASAFNFSVPISNWEG